jgi:hypothetical protein
MVEQTSVAVAVAVAIDAERKLMGDRCAFCFRLCFSSFQFDLA